MNNDHDGCLSKASNQSQLLLGLMSRLWLDKVHRSHWFNFGLKGLIGIGGLMLKRLITQETACHKKEKFLNTFFIKNIKRGRCEKLSGPPKPLGKERSHCSFCARA
jgi:hypothetical protein